MSAENYESLQDHEERIKKLEKRLENIDVGATLDSDASRIVDLEHKVADLITRLDLTLDLIDTKEGK